MNHAAFPILSGASAPVVAASLHVTATSSVPLNVPKRILATIPQPLQARNSRRQTTAWGYSVQWASALHVPPPRNHRGVPARRPQGLRPHRQPGPPESPYPERRRHTDGARPYKGVGALAVSGAAAARLRWPQQFFRRPQLFGRGRRARARPRTRRQRGAYSPPPRRGFDDGGFRRARGRGGEFRHQGAPRRSAIGSSRRQVPDRQNPSMAAKCGAAIFAWNVQSRSARPVNGGRSAACKLWPGQSRERRSSALSAMLPPLNPEVRRVLDGQRLPLARTPSA